MAMDVDIKAAVKALIVAAGLATSVAHADVQRAADTIARQYGQSSSREIEAEIARHLRNRG
jgi:hypothetical protein